MAERPVEDVVKLILADQVGLDEDDVTADTKLDYDGGDGLDLDSLDRIELAMEVEDELGVRVTDDEIERLQTVGEVIEFVRTRAGRG